MSADGAQNRWGGARVWFPPPLVFLLFLAAGLLLQERVRAAFPLGDVARRAAALATLAAGIALVGSTLRLFQRSGQAPEPWKPTPSLIGQGAYRFSRNPMYLGMAVLQAGTGLGLDNAWIAVSALPALLVVHLTAVLPEERYLRARFGESYERYAAAVPRYVGPVRTMR